MTSEGRNTTHRALSMQCVPTGLVVRGPNDMAGDRPAQIDRFGRGVLVIRCRRSAAPNRRFRQGCH